MQHTSRRSFLASLAAAGVPAWLANYHRLSAADRNKVKITDIKTMILQGPRTYTLVRVDTDAGVHGFAEAYGSPGLGIEQATRFHRLSSVDFFLRSRVARK